MPTFIPATPPARPPDWVVVLYCAAWCDTCTQYREKFEAFAEAFAKAFAEASLPARTEQAAPPSARTGGALPGVAAARTDPPTAADRVFVCVDIEDEPEWLGDEDVENFPTLGIQYQGRTLFFGTMLPHIGHLERLLQALTPDSPSAAVQLPTPHLSVARA